MSLSYGRMIGRKWRGDSYLGTCFYLLQTARNRASLPEETVASQLSGIHIEPMFKGRECTPNTYLLKLAGRISIFLHKIESFPTILSRGFFVKFRESSILKYP